MIRFCRLRQVARHATIFLIVLICVGIILDQIMSAQRPTLRKVRERVEQQFPLSSDASAVITWLNAEKIDYVDYRASNHTIRARLRERPNLSLTLRSLPIVFQFDEDNQLTAIIVREEFTGL